MACQAPPVLDGPVGGRFEQIVFHLTVTVQTRVGLAVSEQRTVRGGMRVVASRTESPGHGQMYHGILRLLDRRRLVAGKTQLRLPAHERDRALAVAGGTLASLKWRVGCGFHQTAFPSESMGVVTGRAACALNAVPAVGGKAGFRGDIVTALTDPGEVPGKAITLTGAVRVVAGEAHALGDG